MAAAAPSERGEEGEEGEGYESAEAAKEVSESTGALRVLDDPDGSTDEYDDDDQNGDLDGVAAEARVNELISQLDQVLGALSDTEEANGYLQEEIKQLLAEQDEQEELRNELHDQLKERGELMQMMARQAVSDSSTSTELLDRIRQLRLESELEKKTFTAEMDAIDAQLREIDSSDAQTQVRQGILDDVD